MSPLVHQGEAFSPRYMGVPLATYATEPETAVDTTVAALDALEGFDAIGTVPGGRIGVLRAARRSGLARQTNAYPSTAPTPKGWRQVNLVIYTVLPNPVADPGSAA